MQYFRSRLTCVENILNFHLRRNFYILQFYKKKYAAFPLFSDLFCDCEIASKCFFAHYTRNKSTEIALKSCL